MLARVDWSDGSAVPDAAIEGLLFRSYVDAGFTRGEEARELFAATAVRGRGQLIAAEIDGRLAGLIILVGSGEPGRRFAVPGQGEAQLLAVDPDVRRRGLGRALVQRLLEEAVRRRRGTILLWTQESMVAAQRLYEGAGFARVPARDFTRGGRSFLFYEKELFPGSLA